ncbi:hypothetical protein A9J40_15335 [Stenotrophomonas maltophilia]|nr:hypothetical protein A9J40_15335 [Stenotrophomonas maltophilia]
MSRCRITAAQQGHGPVCGQIGVSGRTLCESLEQIQCQSMLTRSAEGVGQAVMDASVSRRLRCSSLQPRQCVRVIATPQQDNTDVGDSRRFIWCDLHDALEVFLCGVQVVIMGQQRCATSQGWQKAWLKTEYLIKLLLRALPVADFDQKQRQLECQPGVGLRKLLILQAKQRPVLLAG